MNLLRMLFYYTGVSMLDFGSPSKNIFVFLFLGNGALEVFPYQYEGRARSRSQMLSKLETNRRSQWTLALYEHLVEWIVVISSLVNEIGQWEVTSGSV